MKNSFLTLAAALLVGSASLAAADAVVATSVVSGAMNTAGPLKVAVSVASNDTGQTPAGANIRLTFDSAKVTYVNGSVVGTAPYNFTPVGGATATTVSGTIQKIEVSFFGVSGPLTGKIMEADFTVVDGSGTYAITVDGVSGGSSDLVDGAPTFASIARTYDSTGTTQASSVADWAILD